MGGEGRQEGGLGEVGGTSSSELKSARLGG